MRSSGLRAVPTLKYLQSVPAFAEHYHESDDEGDESVDAGPTRGLTWDRRPTPFSDFGLIAIGVPRNRALPANRDPHFYDLGACGPQRTDLKGRDEFCGIFRTPTLRNVALKKSFFHNVLGQPEYRSSL